PLLLLFVVCSMTRPPRTSPLFPYTTLFRSGRPRILDAAAEHAVADVEEHAQADGNPLAGELGDRLPITQFTRERVPVGLGVLLRSEEHTSELQSLTNIVCRLLLEKNKHRVT